MKVLLAVALLVLGAACEQREPKFSDIQIQEVREDTGMTEACLDQLRWGGIEAVDLPFDKCFHMTPPRRWRGLWRDNFEGQYFCPAPATECPNDATKIWLDYEGRAPGQPNPSGGLYAVDFIGRRTVHKGPHGHMGIFDHQMIVDRMIAIRMVKPPPPPPTRAQMEAYWKRCEAAGTCISVHNFSELQNRSD